MASADDLRDYMTFYGVHVDDWEVNFGTFSNHHKILVTEYLSDACSTTTQSEATLSTNAFIYPFHIKRTYFIEGTIFGQITFRASGCTATITKYSVDICRINADNTDEILYTTGWITVNDTLDWDAVYSVGDEIVYPFWIDAWDKSELGEFDRIYVNVRTDTSTCTDTSCSCAYLVHENDATYEDLKVIIPLRM